MAKNYIFDLVQVLFEFNEKNMTAKYFDDDTKISIAQQVIFDRIYCDRLDNGTITGEEVLQEIVSYVIFLSRIF